MQHEAKQGCRSKTWGVCAKQGVQDEAEGCKANDAPPQCHLVHLQQEAVDEVAGVAGLQALGVAAHAAGDEAAHGVQQGVDLVLGAREVLQQRLVHLVELLGGRGVAIWGGG